MGGGNGGTATVGFCCDTDYKITAPALSATRMAAHPRSWNGGNDIAHSFEIRGIRWR